MLCVYAIRYVLSTSYAMLGSDLYICFDVYSELLRQVMCCMYVYLLGNVMFARSAVYACLICMYVMSVCYVCMLCMYALYERMLCV